MKKTLLITLLILVTATFTSAQGLKQNIQVPLPFDSYYSYDEVVTALKVLHKAFPELTKLDMVGKSEEGRAIYCMTINNPKTGKALEKPGVYVDANIHGNELQASEVALYLLNYLLTRYGNNDEVTQTVDKNCIYVIPIIKVDRPDTLTILPI